jgi:threonine aldolase
MLSTKEKISKARVWRKRYGAGMRQVGILAAAGHYALDTNLPLLKHDHRRAHFLAEKLHGIVPSIVDPVNVETNIISLNLSDISLNAAEFVLLLKNEGVLISALGPNFARVVTHLDIDDKGIEFAAEAMGRVLQGTLMA